MLKIPDFIGQKVCMDSTIALCERVHVLLFLCAVQHFHIPNVLLARCDRLELLCGGSVALCSKVVGVLLDGFFLFPLDFFQAIELFSVDLIKLAFDVMDGVVCGGNDDVFQRVHTTICDLNDFIKRDK